MITIKLIDGCVVGNLEKYITHKIINNVVDLRHTGIKFEDMCDYIKNVRGYILKKQIDITNKYINDIIGGPDSNNFLKWIVKNNKSCIVKEMDDEGVIYNVYKISTYALKYNANDIIDYIMDTHDITKFLLEQATIDGNIDMLKRICEKNPKMYTMLLKIAVMNDRQECFKYLYEHGCKIRENIIETIVKNNNVDILDYVTKRNRDIVEDFGYKYAMMYGNKKILEYLVEENIEFDSTSYLEAIKNGNTDCVIMMHRVKKIIPWTVSTFAAIYGMVDCLKYAIENGCECNDFTCVKAVERDNEECFKYLRSIIGMNMDIIKDVAIKNGSYKCLKCIESCM